MTTPAEQAVSKALCAALMEAHNKFASADPRGGLKSSEIGMGHARYLFEILLNLQNTYGKKCAAEFFASYVCFITENCPLDHVMIDVDAQSSPAHPSGERRIDMEL